MFVMADVALQRIIEIGLENLKADNTSFNDIFGTYLEPEMSADYGQAYIDKIRDWFADVKLPVVQSFALNTTQHPCFSIHLASTSEDEAKAAMGDHFGDVNTDAVGVAVYTVNVDIGVHASKQGDYAIWLYYILTYILFKEKLMAERFGLRLQSLNASDFDKDSKYLADNVWTRWCRVRCTTQNHWDQQVNPTLTKTKFNVSFGRVGDEDDDFTI